MVTDLIKATQSSHSHIISQDAKVAMKKSVVLEKKRMRSHSKPNMEMVFDPIGTSTYHARTDMIQIWG